MIHLWVNKENDAHYFGRKEAQKILGRSKFEKMADNGNLLLVKLNCIWENESKKHIPAVADNTEQSR